MVSRMVGSYLLVINLTVWWGVLVSGLWLGCGSCLIGWLRSVCLGLLSSGLPGVFRTVLVFLLQAAFFRSRKSRSTSFGARYPRAE